MPSRRKKFLQDLKARGEFHEPRTGGAVADLLYDDLTDLPTVPLLLGRIRRMLKDSHQLGLLSISVLQNERVEQSLGRRAYESLVQDVASLLLEIKQAALRREDYLSEVMISGNAFVILLSPPRGEKQVSCPDIDAVRRRVAARLGRFIKDRLPPHVVEQFGFYVGCAVLEQRSTVRFERKVYGALEEAFTDSLQERKREQRRSALGLKEVLRSGSLHAVYQPVLDLVERRVIGFEALCRVSEAAFQGP